MPISHIRPVCPAPASPVPRMGPVCTFPPGRPGLPVRLVCGRFPDASGNVELGALALLDTVGIGDLAPGVGTWLHDEVMGDKADRATTLAGYGIADAYTQTETDAAISRAISNVVDSAPAAFDTLKEISDWIGDAGSGAQAVINQVANKVDKVPGKGLSTNDYTATEKAKLSGVEAGAKDNVVEAASASAFPQEGVTGKIYVAKDENKTYRWNGSQYVQIGGSDTAVVPPSTDQDDEGKAADAKATGDALAARPTKAQMDAGWWSEWTVEFYIGSEWVGIDDPRVQEEITSVSLAYDSNDGWQMTLNMVGGNVRELSPSADANDENATRLGFALFGGDDVIRATRHRVAAPVPTKPSDIGAQPAGSYATAAQGEKADAALSRAEAVAGFTEWHPQDGDPGYKIVSTSYSSGKWEVLVKLDGATDPNMYFVTGAQDAVELTFDIGPDPTTIVRTRLPKMADIPAASTAAPQMDGTASAGSSVAFARGDHVHPKDTSKQDAIADLAAIRSGAQAGASAYQKPSGGIPASDMAPAVQTSLSKADAAVRKSDAFGGFVEFFTDSVLGRSRRFVYRPTDTPDVWVLYWIVDGAWTEVPSGPLLPVKYLVWDAAGNGTWRAGSTPDLALESYFTGGTAQYGSATVTLAANGVTAAVLSRAVSSVALASDVKTAVDAVPVRYDLPANATVISSASSEEVEGEAVTYGEATLADRTANRVIVSVAIDELHVLFPARPISGKLRDFGLRIEVGTGSTALTAPALIVDIDSGVESRPILETSDGKMPKLADGTATAKGVTLLYFSETAFRSDAVQGVFLVKGEQVKEVE